MVRRNVGGQAELVESTKSIGLMLKEVQKKTAKLAIKVCAVRAISHFAISDYFRGQATGS